MHNNTTNPYGYTQQGQRVETHQGIRWNPSQTQMPSTNRFIYVNNRLHDPTHGQTVNGSQKVLVNPHFKAKGKVFVNPNFPGCIGTATSRPAIHINPHMKNASVQRDFQSSTVCQFKVENIQCHNSPQSTKIHVNPHVKSVRMPAVSQTVHINPRFTNVATTVLSNTLDTVKTVSTYEAKENVPAQNLNKVVLLTKTKLIRTPSVLNGGKMVKRRNSVKSNYKIVKSGMTPKKEYTTAANRNSGGPNATKNRFKVDNRKRRSLSVSMRPQKKYVYINKLLSTCIMTKSRIIKPGPILKSGRHASVININGTVYRKSRNSLRRTSVSSTKETLNRKRTLNTQHKLINKSNGKIVPKRFVETRTKIIKKFKIIRNQSPRKNKALKISPKKLKTCNIPCPSYKKYGTCKGKDMGKCFWKHDPDQIALCTRFLQGACIKEKCLLSHNVSPEKMPTCKYYLEGSCSRESCPYLHIKISPKAEVCRDFIEGFCKKAAECDKRHQYLCPDYEKYGKCVKQRCPYPHGKMVRTYLINKNKFAKKSSELKNKNKKSTHPNLSTSKSEEPKFSKNEQTSEKQRYYVEKSSKPEESSSESTNLTEDQLDNAKVSDVMKNLKNFVGLHSRPKLGSLPSFIPFGDS